jgi:hypothetical protein
MTITLTEEVERMLRDRAARLGKKPDQLANELLMRGFLPATAVTELPPRDDWEARLLNIGKPSVGVPTDEQLSRENIYED